MRKLALAVAAVAIVAVVATLWRPAERAPAPPAASEPEPIVETTTRAHPPIESPPAHERVVAPVQTLDRAVEPEPEDTTRRSFFVHLIDARSGAAIAHAEVSAGEVAAKTVYAEEVASDDDGAFAIDLIGSQWKRVRIEADGYVSRDLTTDFLHASREEALDVELFRMASLTVRLMDAAGNPVTDTAIWLAQPSASEAVTGRESREPRSLQSLTTDSEGVAHFAGLMPETPVVLRLPPSPVRTAEIDRELALASGEERELVLTLGGAARLEGHAFDEDGKPLAAHGIGLVRVEAAFVDRVDHAELGYGLARSSIASTETRSDGGFVFEGVPPGVWWLEPAAVSFSSALPDGGIGCGVAACAARRVTVEPGRRLVVADIRPKEPARIRARVEGTDGVDPEFRVTRNGAEVPTSWPRKMDGGEFEIGPLPAGLYELAAETYDACSETLSATAGGDVIELHMRPRFLGSIAGVVDDSAPVRRSVQISALRRDAPYDDVQHTSADNDGNFRLDRLRAGVYDLTARSIDGRVGTAGGVDVRDGRDVPIVRIALERAGDVRVRYRGSPVAAKFRASRGDAYIGAGRLRDGERRVIRVPPGRVRVELLVADAVVRTLEVEVLAGGRCDAEFDVP